MPTNFVALLHQKFNTLKRLAKTKKALLINTHLTYPNWTEGTLNNSFFKIAKEFFISKSYEVLETIVEDGYKPDEEEKKHLDAHIVISKASKLVWGSVDLQKVC